MKCVAAATSSSDGTKATAAEKVQADKFCAGLKIYLEELTNKKSRDEGWPTWLHILLVFLSGFVLFGPHAIEGWINIFRGRGGSGGAGGGASADDIAKASAMGALIAADVLSGEVAQGAEATEATSKAAAITAATKRLASVMSPSTVRNPYAVPAYGPLSRSSKTLTWTQMGWGAVGLMAIGGAVMASQRLPDKGRVLVRTPARALAY